jgi:carboxymethylenebutenolidase
MDPKAIPIKTPDGTADVYVFHPAGKGPWPAVLIYMDIFGPRPELFQMAQRLASNGYYVLLPDLYYRSGKYAPFNVQTVFKDDSEKARIMKLKDSINNTLMMRDMGGYLDFLKSQPRVAGAKIGCVGYCMGAPFALAAAGTFPDRVAAAALFHGTKLAIDQPDSPHLLAPKMQAQVYVGVAEIDPNFTKQERDRLGDALTTARVRHTIEIYPNAQHGFAVNGTSAYDREASERHWQRLLELFGQTLPQTR